MRLKTGVTVLLLLFCTACGREELLRNLNSRDSAEIIVVLNRFGISAAREEIESGRRENYRILVNDTDYNSALEVLHEHGLPRQEEKTLDQLTAGSAFSPAGLELTALRKDFALSLEVERLINAMPSVLETKAVVRSVTSALGGLSVEHSAPSASVVIRYSGSTGNPPFSVAEIQQLVARTVPGLQADAVSVELSRAALPVSANSELFNGQTLTTLAPLLFQVPTREKTHAQQQLAALFVLFCLCGGVVGFYLGARNERRQANRNLVLISSSTEETPQLPDSSSEAENS